MESNLVLEGYSLLEWFNPGKIINLGRVPKGLIKPNERRDDETTRPDPVKVRIAGRCFMIEYFHGGIPGNVTEIDC